jgi:hypothetical protein
VGSARVVQIAVIDLHNYIVEVGASVVARYFSCPGTRHAGLAVDQPWLTDVNNYVVD